MYVFICPKGHKSYSASKEQYAPECPECGEPTERLDESTVRDALAPKEKS